LIADVRKLLNHLTTEKQLGEKTTIAATASKVNPSFTNKCEQKKGSSSAALSPSSGHSLKIAKLENKVAASTSLAQCNFVKLLQASSAPSVMFDGEFVSIKFNLWLFFAISHNRLTTS
jgi:hypothetical protein